MSRWIASLLIIVAALVAAPAALADHSDSSNWAGYAAHGARFHRVSGVWRQPALHCVKGKAAYSAYWVGLGGYSGNALEQIGTEADCNTRGQASVSAWYEMVPAASVPLTMTVVAGDLMFGEVTVTGHTATLELQNRTRHRTFIKTVSSASIDITSAEWIVEAPSECGSTCLTLPLANFGSAHFSTARAENVAGHWGTITDRNWSTTAIRLVASTAQLASAASGTQSAGNAVPTALSAGGSSFQVGFSTTAPTATWFGTRLGAHPLGPVHRAGHHVTGA